MEVAATGARRPFISDEGREDAGLVELLRRRREALPDRLRECVLPGQRILACHHSLTPHQVCLAVFAPLHEIVNPATELRPQEIGVRLRDHRGQPQVLGVIGNDQEIEWANEPRPYAGAGHDNLPPRESVRVIRPQDVAEHASIGGVGGVHVGIAPEHPLRKSTSEMRGVLPSADSYAGAVDGDILSLNGRSRKCRYPYQPEGGQYSLAACHDIISI